GDVHRLLARILETERRMRDYFLVFLGAGLGGAARHAVNSAALYLLGPALPFGTLFVNVVGSFAMGGLIECLSLRADLGVAYRLFLTTGFLGGFTTFSAFSLDALALYERGQLLWCAAYVVASVALALLGVMCGALLARAVI